jgi:hypothetical protein
MKFEDRDYTIGEIFKPAMIITDPTEAAEYFHAIVQYHMDRYGQTREEATNAQRFNLAYFAGYYDQETRLRVEKLFCCTHPILGAASDGAPTPAEAFELGARMAKGE